MSPLRTGSIAYITAILSAIAGPLAAGVRVSEILAVNDRSGGDEDGDPSDWVELSNEGPEPVDLGGWFLTDDPLRLTKWRVPATIVPAGGFLVVFASGKNRAVPGAELHASFRLDGDGEYFALVRPDGSIAEELVPGFPPQRADVSWGFAMESVVLAGDGSLAEFLVPAPGALDPSWREAGFAGGPGWAAGPLGIGFDSEGGTPTGLVSAWMLDGDFADAFGANDGAFAGAAGPVFAAGFDGSPAGALRLDGTSGYVRVDQNGGLPIFNRPAYTVALWVRGLRQADRRVFSEGSSSNNSPVFNIGVDRSGASGAVDIFIRDGAGSLMVGHRLSRAVAFDGAWHHIAWTDAGGDAALFIDGVRDETDFSYSKRELPLDRTSIGAILRAADSFHFAGDIDDVSLWDRVLSAGEIASLVAGRRPLELGALDGLIATDIGATMQGASSSLLVRIPFDSSSGDPFDALDLDVRYDDGFVAFLNGVEVARRNAPEALSWDSAATAPRSGEEAVAVERIVLSEHLQALLPGRNVLAFHALNASRDDPDFLLAPRLIASSRAGAARYFSPPTPGAPNRGGFLGFVRDTKFSADRGFHDEPFDVEIRTATPGAEVRYTLDGSVPGAASGMVARGPIRIEDTTVLRAAAFLDGYIPSNTDTQTYIFPADVLRQTRPPGYPATWGGIAADYDMDPDLGADPDFASRFPDALRALPVVSVVTHRDHLFGPTGIYQDPAQRGAASERPASVELLARDEGVQVDAGLRPFGNTSRSLSATAKQGFRLVFRREYGPGRFRFPVFPDSPVESFDTLVLRTNFTDSWLSASAGERAGAQYVRDEWMRRRQLAMGRPAAHGAFVHLFLNGLYWGVYDLTERPDASFAASYLGGDEDEWDVIKNHEEVLDGESFAYRELDALARADLRNDAAYAEVSARIDTDNLIDYMVLNMLAPATDWPGNYYMSRRRVPDGQWRFFVWDSDKLFFEGMGVDRTGPHWRDRDSPTKFHHALRANAEYRVRFGDRFHRHLSAGGAFSAAEVERSWRALAKELELALIAESLRWGDNRRAEPYRPEVEWAAATDALVSGLTARPDLLLDQFRCNVAWAGCEPLVPDVPAPELDRPGGRVTPGDDVGLWAAAGEVHFTLDGTDPRLPGGALSPGALLWGGTAMLLEPGAPARVVVPGPELAGADWTAPDFDDSAWLEGTTGVGYERSSGFEDAIGLDVLSAMDGINASVWVRVPFTVDAPGEVSSLVLRMMYDDGYVAFLNGREIARRNAPDDLSWNAESTTVRADADALVFEEANVPLAKGLLRRGRNVLGVHGLNSSATSSDLLVLPALRAVTRTAERIVLERTTTVRARAFEGGAWSPLEEATYVTDTPLRITEIMYHPRGTGPVDGQDADDFEFIELQNTGGDVVELDGVRIDESVEFDFSGSSVPRLKPGEVAVVVADLDAFAARYDVGAIAVAGVYDGRLRNSGERLRLLDADGHAILEFAWDDRWHPETDGAGHSLTIRDPLPPPEAWGDAVAWVPSEVLDGTPGIHERGGPPPANRQLPGDADLDGTLSITDPVRVLLVLFSDPGLALPCAGALEEGGNLAFLDANGDGRVDLSDPIAVLAYLFSSGRPHALGTECVTLEGCGSGCR